MKTSELQGAALDYAVAKCEYPGAEHLITRQYSTDWAQGGPIIERKRMVLAAKETEWVANLKHTRVVTYAPRTAMRYLLQGETALIAAMRCYVQSKLGDEVEIPEKLK